MNKVFKTIIAAALIFFMFVPNVLAAGITDSSVFIKQEVRGTCTLASNTMLLRRAALLADDTKWQNITEAKLKSKLWSSNGMDTKYSYSGVNVTAYRIEPTGAKHTYDFKLGDVDARKSFFIEQLEKHPEGIVVYVFFSSNYMHAVLLTDYDSKTGTFYCSDPASSAPDGRIKLADSILPGYIKNGYSKHNKNLSNQDLVIGYIQQIWMISGGKWNGKDTPASACSDHNYNEKGRCTRCGVEFQMVMTSMPATAYYAIKDDVPVRLGPNSGQDVQKRLKKGETVTVVASGKNAAGNLWYKLNDGNWIFSDNVTRATTAACKHTSYDDSGYCASCKTEFQMTMTSMSATTYYAVKDDVPVRVRPYAPETVKKRLKKGEAVTVVSSGKNAPGNLWYKLNDGNWIFSDNVTKTATVACKHPSYNDSGYCTSCKTEFQMTMTSMSATTYYAVKDDVPVRVRPYAPETVKKRLKKGEAVTVVSSGKNAPGNLWYKLNDGSWIFSDNVSKQK